MVRNLIIALCATIMFSCSDKDTMQEIDAIYQKPVTLGILEQLQKDVKNQNSVTGKSNDPYITSCIDDRPEVVISGPISNPSSFVDGSDRLDLDFFTFENKDYVLIRSEDSLSYGLPNDYVRIHYIKESSNQLGVYRNDGHQASVSGNWDFLFNSPDLMYLYEIDLNYNVIGGPKPLSTINIQCDAYEGWYAANYDNIDWSQGVSGAWDSYGKEIDSLFIRLNSKGDYIGGGYLYLNDFYLENAWTEDIDDRCVNSYYGTSAPVPGEYVFGSNWTHTQADGTIYYSYCIEEQNQYELKGYQLRSNGSTINFVWYPDGKSDLDYIGQIDLTKINKAPNQNELTAAKLASHSTDNIFDLFGHLFNGDIYNNEQKYVYVEMKETGLTGYLKDSKTTNPITGIVCYDTEYIPFKNHINLDHPLDNKAVEFGDSTSAIQTTQAWVWVTGTINDPYLWMYTNEYDANGDWVDQVYTKLTPASLAPPEDCN